MNIRKRFAAFCLSSGLMTLIAFFAPAESVSVAIQFIGAAYAVYLGGQSATDWVTAKNGHK